MENLLAKKKPYVSHFIIQNYFKKLIDNIKKIRRKAFI